MTWFDSLMESDNVAAMLAGIAGAAAMAATDWRTPIRFAQHLFVGTVTAAVATPFAFPTLSFLLSILKVDPSAQESSAAFITGAFGIYLFEYVIILWRRKYGKSNGRSDEKDIDRDKA